MALITAIAGLIGAVGTFIAGSFLLKTAVGIGLSLLAQAIAGKPKDPTFSINGTLQSGGDVPRSFIVGKTATAGSLVWVNTWGRSGDTPNAFLTQVIALSDMPLQSLDDVWVNGEKVTLGSTPHPQYGYPVNGYGGNLWVKFHDGTQTTEDSFLRTHASNSQRQWQSTRVGHGVAYAVVTAKVTQNHFSGIPSFKFAITGMPLYDPSKDSTVPGGSGPHRLNNPATWGGDGDHNPVVQIYNLLLGITQNDQWFYGLQGVSAARLPSVNWIEQINKCRAGNIYRAGGEIPVEAPLATAIEALLTACQGRLSEVGGFYRIYVGEPDAPVASFDDGDIISTDEQSFTPFFGLADTINGIAATYPSPADGWSVKAAPPIYRTDLEVLAGNRRLMADVSLDFVPYPEQAQRLMKSALAEGQRARRHTLVLPPTFWPYAVPGAVLSWSSERNGYINKWFRIDGAVDRANLDVMIDITEVDPSDFDWDSDTDYNVPVDGAVGVIRPPAQPIVDWAAFPDSVQDNDGVNRRAAIRVTWDNTEGRLDDVVGVEFEVRLAGSSDVVYRGRTDQPDAGSLLISQGILPLTRYEVRGKFIPGGDRETLWSGWLLVLTLDIRITDITAYLRGIGEDVYAAIERIRIEQDDLRAYVQTLAQGTDEVAGRVVDERFVAKRFRDASAVALSTLTAAISDDEGNLIAVAEALTAVQAAVGNISADGLRKIEVQAGTGDVVARLVDMVRATVDDVWVEAGTIVEVGFEDADPLKPFSNYYILASKFGIIDPNDGDSKVALFATINGKTYINVALIGHLTADQIDTASIAADEAFLEELVVTNANIENLTLTAEKLAIGALRRYETDTGSGAKTGWTTIASVDVNNESGGPVECWVNARLETASGGGAISWRVRRGETTILSDSFSSGGVSSTTRFNAVPDVAASVGIATYELQAIHTSGSASFSGDITCTWSLR